MSEQTDMAEQQIIAMLAGDKTAERVCRLTLERAAKSERTPAEAIADMMRAAIHAQEDFHENN